MIGRIIVDINAKQVNRPFDYLIPSNLESVIEIGSRVIVPFGSRKLMGFVIDVISNSEFPNLKKISECLDIIPVLDKEMIELANKIANSTSCFIIDVLQAMIPQAYKAKYEKRIKVISDSSFNDLELINDKTNLKLLKKEIEENKVEIIYDYKENGIIKTKKYVKLIDFDYQGTKKQNEIISLLLENDLPKSDLSINIVNTLVEKGVVCVYDKETYREIYSNSIDKNVTLNSEQIEAYNRINKSFNKNDIFLLKGVTGSGKTEIYLNIIEEVLKNGKEAIMLVPEISLTPMMVNRFKGRFKDDVAVLHSGLSNGEKYDEYRRILKKEAKIVVGARSAIFAPLKNIGIIIIDEEHEESYKQDSIPRYSAIDVAKYRSKYHNCPLLLGSATPSIISYTKALNKEYILLELKKRANNALMPKMNLVNMVDELKSGNKSIISNKLNELIIERLNKNEQIILLLNRRGHSNFVMCRDCGNVISCPNCDISLTYHKSNNKLKCHYCGYEIDNVVNCPSCNSKHIRYVGIGTEQVEEMIKNTYNANVLRMDLDTTSTKNAHQIILDKFKNHEADILIGTQMIAKGLDFPLVTLVGVINADMILKFPEYTNSEKTFELIEQVAGRAGRHNKLGEVVVQGYNTDHYSINCAIANDYDKFYDKEMQIRKICNYPPYVKMCKLSFASKDSNLVNNEALKIANRFKELYKDMIVLGPTSDVIYKMNNYYRVNVILKYKDDITDKLTKLNEYYQNKEVSISIDNKE